MNFEKIELIGFKSFADKMEIVFDSGVTGIVGPNGCGKSNIADAIRWVLGEQSAKTMRGTAMADVIFNGTQNRKSLSYCEVSLFFDNSNKIFPSSEFNEVILTRKLFRDGTSEYYVNKQLARRIDIVNLLHECGMSKDGYSIIGQGKVSEIFSSSPENRRVIFEEAVGIAKTKKEKIDNENKLARTRENICRIADLTNELDRQIEPARRACEKTKNSIELHEKLKYNEINNYLYKYESSNSVKEKINFRLQSLIEEYKQRDLECQKANEDYNTHMAEISEFDRKINELNDKILSETVKQERNEGNTKLFNEKISFLKNDSIRLNAESDEKREKMDFCEKTILSSGEYINECSKEVDELNVKIDSLNAKLSNVLREIETGENLAQSAQSKILQSADKIADINRNIGSLDTEKNVISSQQKEVLDKVTALTATYNRITEECSRLKAEIFNNENLQKQLSLDIEQTEKSIVDANNKVSDYANQIYKLNISINSLETNQRIYTNLKESYEGYPLSVKNLMTSAKVNAELNAKIKGVVASLVKTDTKFETAISTSLGNSVQNIVTKTPDDARYLIEYLKRNNGGLVTFLPISSVRPRYDSQDAISALKENGVLGLATKIVKFEKEYENVIQFLLGNTLIVDHIRNAVQIAEKYRYSFKIVTIDGDVINSSGSMTGGSRRQNQANFLSTDGKIEKINQELAALRSELKRLTLFKDQETSKSNSFVDVLNDENKALTDCKLSLTALKEKLASLQEVAKNCSDEIQANNEVLNSIVFRLDDISKKYVDVEQGNRKLIEEKEIASDVAIKHQNEYDKLRRARDELADENTKLQSRLSFLNSELRSAGDNVERMKKEFADCENQIAKNDEMVAQNDKSIQELYDNIELLTHDYEENSGIKILREQLIDFKNRKSRLNDKISQDDLKRQVLANELTKLNEKKHNEEMLIAKVDTELNFMQQRVEEEYKLTYETCKDMRDPDYDFATSQQTITELRKKISQLGPVNPTAIEDFENIRTRYDELMVQRVDLEKAEDDIKKAIKTLTDEMLTIFNEGFEQIRSHFQLIFKQLFGGGRADLLLNYDNVDDPLEAGVEIVAEPPGKKLQKISLLSGGEMSLTAIAILFAILKLRPMPFCVLDEIEAALDDANVERFAKYLQNFSKETQFIVITHKKVTMELSDALFGVTMQEKGVSKIVSVKFADIKDTNFD